MLVNKEKTQKLCHETESLHEFQPQFELVKCPTLPITCLDFAVIVGCGNLVFQQLMQSVHGYLKKEKSGHRIRMRVVASLQNFLPSA